MSNRVIIHGMWGLRLCDADCGVDLALATFQRLGEAISECREWYRPYHTIADRKRGPVSLLGNSDLIRSELLDSQVGDDGKVDENGGYELLAWSGPEKSPATEWTEFDVRFGKRTVLAGPNIVIIRLPGDDARLGFFKDPHLLHRAIESLAEIWKPDWLSVRNPLTTVVRAPWTHGPALGWINYLSPNVGTIETLPHGWSWLSPGGKCPTFIHEGGLPSLDNPAHVAAYTRLMESVQWKTDRPIGNPPAS